MSIKIEIKLKLDNGTDITLSDEDAKNLYLKLKEIYHKEPITYIPYYPTPYPWYRSYPTAPWTYTITNDGTCNAAGISQIEVSSLT